ncbi:MAG TPA: DUF2460 domain-containing protein [Stellaceae bacterium]|jgi:uncharacterized protein (TIGR02217 family)|nr:DUF2460 domain-containing protein [Stellaceae bacterium]
MSTIIPDIAEVFPTCPTFGFIAEPNYLVKITAREGGYERRQRVWAMPLSKYTGVPSGDQPSEDIEILLDFWNAMGGMSSGFRFKDWIDYKSCHTSQTPTALDQPLVLSGDSPVSYRLVKQYSTLSGRTIQQRYIQRPIGSTVLVANALGVTQEDWSLDESTGLLTPGGTFSGVPTRWGGEFDVWCRFDAIFNPSITDWGTNAVMNVTVQLAEIRVPLA